MPSLKTPSENRFLRQQGLIPTSKLQQTSATIIGVGAIGRQVAIQLASLGVGKLQLIDFDVVESHNVTSQGFRASEIGMPKVKAVEDAILEIDADINVEVIQDRFRLRTQCSEVVFCCVDSIQTRSLIWKHLQRRISFWSDARMLGEVIRMLTATDDLRSNEKYSESLFDRSEVQAGSCTSRSTIYTANIAAGLMVHQFTRWIRGVPLDDDLCFNLLSSELTPT